jgi:hypothetical protein
VAKPRADDLFELFPDLPRPRRARADGFLVKVQQQVEAARQRARANVEKQRARSERVKATLSRDSVRRR